MFWALKISAFLHAFQSNYSLKSKKHGKKEELEYPNINRQRGNKKICSRFLHLFIVLSSTHHIRTTVAFSFMDGVMSKIGFLSYFCCMLHSVLTFMPLKKDISINRTKKNLQNRRNYRIFCFFGNKNKKKRRNWKKQIDFCFCLWNK